MPKRKENSSSKRLIIFIISFIVIIWFFIPKGQKNYTLKFSDDFKKGLTTVDNLGISIVIAVDCSGSMSEYPDKGYEYKYKIASKALKEMLKFLQEYYNSLKKEENFILKIGLLTFSENYNILFPLTNMNEDNFNLLKNIVNNENNFKPDSTTAIGKTIEKGVEILLQSETIFKSLIVITDGVNTEGVAPEKVLDAVVNNRNNKTSPDMPILTSSILISLIGFDIDDKYFKDLEKYGVRIVSAYNQKELIEALKSVIIADITKLESI